MKYVTGKYPKYPGWRTMTAAQRYNARMARIWEDARARERQAAAQNDAEAQPSVTADATHTD